MSTVKTEQAYVELPTGEVFIKIGFLKVIARVIGNVLCPLLAIHGDSDEYGSIAFTKIIAEQFGGDSHLSVIKCCGHMLHREKHQKCW